MYPGFQLSYLIIFTLYSFKSIHIILNKSTVSEISSILNDFPAFFHLHKGYWFENLVISFNPSWLNSIESIVGKMMIYFSNHSTKMISCWFVKLIVFTTQRLCSIWFKLKDFLQIICPIYSLFSDHSIIFS